MDIWVYADWKELDGPVLMGVLSVVHTKGHEVFSFAFPGLISRPMGSCVDGKKRSHLRQNGRKKRKNSEPRTSRKWADIEHISHRQFALLPTGAVRSKIFQSQFIKGRIYYQRYEERGDRVAKNSQTLQYSNKRTRLNGEGF